MSRSERINMNKAKGTYPFSSVVLMLDTLNEGLELSIFNNKNLLTDLSNGVFFIVSCEL